MQSRKHLKINTSITDFAPLLRDQEYLFERLKQTGIDSIELVVGVKSRWSVKHIQYLSSKYDLPIVSIHQPIWAGLGLYSDEHFFEIAKQLGAKTVTCHPLPGLSFTDEKMKRYLQKLADIKKQKQLDILLENMSPTYQMNIIDALFPLHADVSNLQKVANAAQDYGLKLTLDIDHMHNVAPHQEPWFDTILPQVGNVHISSFSKGRLHLPLSQGDFQAQSFLHHLLEKNYQGLLTLEIYYPDLITLFNYDFDAIRESVAIIRNEK